MFLIVVTVAVIVFLILIYFSSSTNFISSKRTVLFVTAHPDDECMFFGPTILHSLKNDCVVHLLCLTSGGFYKQSSKRKKELQESCRILGIPCGNVTIIEHSKLPDDPNILWDEERVGNIILKYIEQLSVNIVFSFDDYGVSGHWNHKAICYGLKYLQSDRLLPKGCKVYILKSVSLLWKYLGPCDVLLDVPLSILFRNLYFVSKIEDVNILWKSMKAHYSQYVWFRKLYIIFSRYVFINTFIELVDHSENVCDAPFQDYVGPIFLS